MSPVLHLSLFLLQLQSFELFPENKIFTPPFSFVQLPFIQESPHFTWEYIYFLKLKGQSTIFSQFYRLSTFFLTNDRIPSFTDHNQEINAVTMMNNQVVNLTQTLSLMLTKP